MIEAFRQLREIPETAGVYMIKDKEGKIIYISRAENIKERIKFHLSHTGSNRNKTISKHIRSVDFEVYDNRLDATKRELELIQQHYPPLNGPRKGIKQYRFVKLHLDERWARARKKKFIEEGDDDLLGPFPKSHHIAVVISLAANYYRIADCGKKIILGDDHKIVRTCIRRQTRQCMRPCEVEVDAEQYNDAVKGFIAFFEGRDLQLIDDLETDMKQAVSEQKFELAAKKRDELEAIKKIGLGK